MSISQLKAFAESVNYAGLDGLLSRQPLLANEPLPLDEHNGALAHPLHRLCDGVALGKYTDAEAARMAEIFLRHGARVNGKVLRTRHDTPLIAAASLRADAVALLLIEKGADIHHMGTHGGTALHWACWCGRDRVVERILREKVDVNQQCIDFRATPLGWAVHGYNFNGKRTPDAYVTCVRLLLDGGADKEIPNGDGSTPYALLSESDRELVAMLR